MMPRFVGRLPVIVAAVMAIAGVGVYLAVSEPMDDMRSRADALELPADYVLVSESYSPGATRGVPHLERTYHAAGPGMCDSLRSLRDRSGTPFEVAMPPPEAPDDICFFGSMVPAGWPGRLRNYANYQVQFTARSPERVEPMGPQPPHGSVVLHPRGDDASDRMIRIPAGRARVDVEFMALRGQ